MSFDDEPDQEWAEEAFGHITDKYFPLGLDDESGGSDEDGPLPYSPSAGAW